MSSKDKTRQKLMGSMRKTKAEAGLGSEKTGEAKASPSVPESRPRQQKKTSAAPKTRTASRETGDPYRSGRRIWPD